MRICTIFAAKETDKFQFMTPRRQITFRLDTDLISRLKLEADIRNCSLNSLVEEILREFIDSMQGYSPEERELAYQIIGGIREAQKIEKEEAEGCEVKDLLKCV